MAMPRITQATIVEAYTLARGNAYLETVMMIAEAIIRDHCPLLAFYADGGQLVDLVQFAEFPAETLVLRTQQYMDECEILASHLGCGFVPARTLASLLAERNQRRQSEDALACPTKPVWFC